MLVFYFFAAIVIWLGILSLRGGIRFAQYGRRESARPLPEFTPFASVIAPCRGLDQGLRENVTALCNQSYPTYEIIFVTDKVEDPSLNVIEQVRSCDGNSKGPVRIIVAGEATDSGQKVHNLRVAAQEIAPNSRVLVFVDSDARPHQNWLRLLVAPLSRADLLPTCARSGMLRLLPRWGSSRTRTSVGAVRQQFGGRRSKSCRSGTIGAVQCLTISP